MTFSRFCQFHSSNIKHIHLSALLFLFFWKLKLVVCTLLYPLALLNSKIIALMKWKLVHVLVYFFLHWLLLFFMNLFGYMAHQTWVVWILVEFSTFFLVFLLLLVTVPIFNPYNLNGFNSICRLYLNFHFFENFSVWSAKIFNFQLHNVESFGNLTVININH